MPHRAIEDTRDYYDELATVYDHATVSGAWTPNDVLARELALSNPPATGLDLGCGTGHTLDVLRTRWPSAAYTGVDASEAMLSRARDKHPDVTFSQDDIAGFVSTATRRFDLVTAIGCFEFVLDLPEIIRSIAERLVNSGGLLAFTYEPLIVGLEGQDQRLTVRKGTRGAVTTFRWSPIAVKNALTKNALVQHESLFVSYYREELPVVYHLLVARL